MSSTNNSALYVDITELVNWQGKLTGVPRVMDELATRLNNSDATFVVWNTDSKKLELSDYFLEQKTQKPDGKGSIHSKVLRRFSKASNNQTTSPNAEIKPNDTLVVLADWHGSDHSFIEYLVGIKKSGAHLIQICYDMLPIVTPQFSGHATESFTKYVNEVYPICDTIISISENTKKDVAAYLKDHKLNIPNLTTIRLGDDFNHMEQKLENQEKKQLESKLGGHSEFLLCVGTVEARKNHALLYYTYKLAQERGVDLPPVVIVGRRGWLSENIYEIITKDSGTKQKFIFLENIADAQLSWLYNNCLFSVYPSFYEGWGLPVAESISRGVPCVCSRTSSIPEIGGELLTYFSPYSTEECLNAISKTLHPDELSNARNLAKKYKPTPWDNTFAEFIKAAGVNNG